MVLAFEVARAASGSFGCALRKSAKVSAQDDRLVVVRKQVPRLRLGMEKQKSKGGAAVAVAA
jgi:hypothetical protein